MRNRSTARRRVSSLSALLAGAAASASAQTPEERRPRATSPIEARTRGRHGARHAQGATRRQRPRVARATCPVQSNGTILDASGLTVLPLSALEPPASAFGRGGGDVTTEMTELRIASGRRPRAARAGRAARSRSGSRPPDARPTPRRPPLPAIDAPDGVPASDRSRRSSIQRASESVRLAHVRGVHVRADGRRAAAAVLLRLARVAQRRGPAPRIPFSTSRQVPRHHLADRRHARESARCARAGQRYSGAGETGGGEIDTCRIDDFQSRHRRFTDDCRLNMGDWGRVRQLRRGPVSSYMRARCPNSTRRS